MLGAHLAPGSHPIQVPTLAENLTPQGTQKVHPSKWLLL